MSIIKMTGSEVSIDGDVATVYVPKAYKHMIGIMKSRSDVIKEELSVRKVRFEVASGIAKDSPVNAGESVAHLVEQIPMCLLPSWDVVALDFETSGVDSRFCDIYAFALTDCASLRTVYYDIRSEDNLIGQLVSYLRGKTVVVHNMSFERKLLDRIGASDYQIVDTMILAYLDNSERPKGLKSLAKELFNLNMVEYKQLVGTGKKEISYLDVPRDKAAQYCGEDTYVTALLYNKLKNEVNPMLVDLDHRTAHSCIDLECAGIVVDYERLESLESKVRNWIELITKKMYFLAGQELNLGSPKQLNEVIYTKLKIVPTKDCYTDKGALSTSEAAINSLVQHGVRSPFLALLLKYRELTKILGTYILPIIKYTDSGKKRLYTSLLYCGTGTGRFASSDPNLQNLPASGLGKEVRACLIAPKGSSILTLDYSQIEICILAHLMNDQGVIESIKNGVDMHTATASKVFKLPLDGISKDMRSRAKKLNFSKIYGEGITATAKALAITKDEALEIEQMYYDAFPSIKNTINQEILSCKLLGYTSTLLGRKRWLPDINSPREYMRARAERQTFNTVIQGTASEVARCLCIRIREELSPKYPMVKFILQVHDEFVFEVPDDQIESFSRDLADIAVKPFNINGYTDELLVLRVPLKVEIGVGKNYADAK